MRRTIRTTVTTAVLGTLLWGLGGCSEGVTSVPTLAEPPRAPMPVTMSQPSRPVGEPTRLTIPAIGVDERLHGVGLMSNGAMATPDFGDAGWYDRGPRPGAIGPAVIVAHVHGPAGDDVFADLDELEAGDRVTVRRTDGVSTFVVRSSEQARKDALPYDRIWSADGRPVLRLITCGGRPDPVTRTYPDNTIVYADLFR